MACMCGGQLRIATSDAAGLQRQHGGHGSVESVVSSLRAHVPGTQRPSIRAGSGLVLFYYVRPEFCCTTSLPQVNSSLPFLVHHVHAGTCVSHGWSR